MRKELRKLRAFFVEKDVALNEVATFLGITRQSLYNKLEGKFLFTQEEIKKLQTAYNIPNSYFK